MAYGRRDPWALDAFTLSPLPYPVLLILVVILLLIGVSSFFSYEEMMETAEVQMSWVLLLLPLALLLLIRLLSSSDSLFDGTGLPGFLFPFDSRRRRPPCFYDDAWPQDAGSASPWGVAAAVVLLIILASFHSSLMDMWGP